jgi:hypothetical protein
MVTLLTNCVRERGLRLQSEEAMINMVAAWAEGKPRIALNLLEGFSPGSSVPTEVIKEFIDYIDVEDIIPLLQSLSGSMTQGLSYIMEMKLNTSFIPVLIEIFKVRKGMASFKLSLTDTRKVREQLGGVPLDNLIKFIYLVTSLPVLSSSGLISAFLQSHIDFQVLSAPPSPTDTLQIEVQQKLDAPKPGVAGTTRPAAPSLSELLQKGVVLGQ